MKKIIILLILLTPLISHSQVMKLDPGQTYTNRSADTLIITSFEKIKSAVITKREFKIALKEIDKSNEIIQNLEQQTQAFEEKSDAQKEIIESSEKQIANCEIYADSMKKEAVKQKRQKKIILVAGGALLILAFIF